MKNRKIIYSILITLTVLATILSGIIFSIRKNELKVSFLDVGQGDAILISQGSNQLLIDGGKDGKVLLEKLGRYIPFWDRNIEVMLATHPDQDHIGGLVDALRTYRVQTVLKTNAESDSQIYKKLEEEIGKSGAQKVETKKGLTIKFSNEAAAGILFPIDSLSETVDNASNDNSVVVKLTYGENTFLFTGDLPSTQESVLINSGQNLSAQILKTSHHGSKYATSNEFLEAVKPQEAIISVGKNNSYGHPNQEVLQRLLQYKINILRTDEKGDIIYECIDPESGCQLQNS
jgi:competence protein ComEC